jgi:hypothetical protein
MGEEATTNNLNLRVLLCGINITSKVSTFLSGTSYTTPFSYKWNKILSIVGRNVPFGNATIR